MEKKIRNTTDFDFHKYHVNIIEQAIAKCPRYQMSGAYIAWKSVIYKETITKGP